MTWDPSKYIKLLLGRPLEGPDRWLIALRTTADYYGWTEEFEEWRPRVIGTSQGYQLAVHPGTRGKMYCEPGRRHRISRSPKRTGHPAGYVNAFKLSRSCGLLDIAELAHFTKGDWYWMERPRGGRASREEWAAIYEAGTQRREGGLVSV